MQFFRFADVWNKGMNPSILVERLAFLHKTQEQEHPLELKFFMEACDRRPNEVEGMAKVVGYLDLCRRRHPCTAAILLRPEAGGGVRWRYARLGEERRHRLGGETRGRRRIG